MHINDCSKRSYGQVKQQPLYNHLKVGAIPKNRVRFAMRQLASLATVYEKLMPRQSEGHFWYEC